MRILVLGGTWFPGRSIAQEALRRRWDVTTFDRGRSARDVPGARAVRGDRTHVADLNRPAAEGTWGAMIDTSSSGLPPRDVRLAARALRDAASRWVHVSSVSVYAGWPHRALTEASEVLECPADAAETFGWTGTDGSPTRYGFQKAGGERAVAEAFGERAVFLRPGVVLGPGEYVGRLPWWLHRARRGGPMPAPAPADRIVQPVDVRDVALFAVDRAAAATAGGAYDVAHPEGMSFGDFLRACPTVTDSDGHAVWAEPEVLVEHEVRQWTEPPLWRTHAGVWSVDAGRAVAAGLRCRPLTGTIADTWAWLRADGRPVAHPRWARHGLASEKEARILTALAGAGAVPR